MKHNDIISELRNALITDLHRQKSIKLIFSSKRRLAYEITQNVFNLYIKLCNEGFDSPIESLNLQLMHIVKIDKELIHEYELSDLTNKISYAHSTNYLKTKIAILEEESLIFEYWSSIIKNKFMK